MDTSVMYCKKKIQVEKSKQQLFGVYQKTLIKTKYRKFINYSYEGVLQPFSLFHQAAFELVLRGSNGDERKICEDRLKKKLSNIFFKLEVTDVVFAPRLNYFTLKDRIDKYPTLLKPTRIDRLYLNYFKCLKLWCKCHSLIYYHSDAWLCEVCKRVDMYEFEGIYNLTGHFEWCKGKEYVDDQI